MPEIPQKERVARFKKLPPALQGAMFSPTVAQNIGAISQKHKVNDKVHILAQLIGEVFLGILHPNELIPRLVERLSMSQEQAKALAIEVSQTIFTPVRTELLAMYRSPGGQQITGNLKLVTTPQTPPSETRPLVSTFQPPIPQSAAKPLGMAGGPPPATPSRSDGGLGASPAPLDGGPASIGNVKPLTPTPNLTARKPPFTFPPNAPKLSDATSTAHLVTPKPFVPSAPLPPPPSNAPKPFISPTPSATPTLQPKPPVSPPSSPPPVPNRGASPPPTAPLPPPKPPTPPGLGAI